ncbi:unnamed protein product [Musa acuminata subsp. malaccensis]|uniref:(wild Malaysian banana) hypothetical protein n=1 Tax=Musa acuminata subsp. malaccensis TaxID=214687 RepID=A0A804JYH3_MUSAM|nr:unnamed protein product [Musa acuminata subsp. malaccensis]
MERMTDQKHSIVEFFKEKGFDDESINRLMRRCNRLESTGRGRATESWDYLGSIGIQKRRLLYVVSKCPKILTMGLNQKLVTTVRCLATLGSKPGEVTSAITKFPHIVSCSVEEKLCPLLAFFHMLGISDKQLGKMLLLNPRLISCSVETKLTQITDFLASIGLNKEGLIVYPEFFRHGEKKSLEFRHKLLKQKNVHCSLSEMLSCNRKMFIAKYGLAAGFS